MSAVTSHDVLGVSNVIAATLSHEIVGLTLSVMVTV